VAQPPARTLLGSLLLCLIAGIAGAQTLPERLDAIANRPLFAHSVWGIVVTDETGNVLYARNAGTLLMPASNRKLFTAAAVSDCIGFDHRFATEAKCGPFQHQDPNYGQ